MSHPHATRLLHRLLAALLLIGFLVAPAAATRRRAFVTSVSGPGDLSQWSGALGTSAHDRADSICRARAAAAALPNSGSYVAWLSTPDADAYCHIQGLTGDRFTGCDGAATFVGGGPWYLANGITNFTGDLDALMVPTGVIYRPVMMDETGTMVASSDNTRVYWTGTHEAGNGSDMTCTGWTSASPNQYGAVGDAFGSSMRWTYAADDACSESHRLLCLETGASETTSLRWTPGAIVFVTSEKGTGNLSTWPSANGAVSVSAGYQICQTLAAQAHLPNPGSFVPWLSTSLVDALSRVTTKGPFRRLDSFTVASNSSELYGGALPNSINVNEKGEYFYDWEGDTVYTGTLSNGTVASETCNGWLAGDDSSLGMTGRAGLSRTWEWTADDVQGQGCSTPGHLYCISNVVMDSWDGFESGDLSRWTAKAP